jgi:competence CoiA-like predicted nuclease
MARLTECVINIDLANALRNVIKEMRLHPPNGDIGFYCPGCHGAVKPMVVGSNDQAAHFEHIQLNMKCEFCDPGTKRHHEMQKSAGNEQS